MHCECAHIPALPHFHGGKRHESRPFHDYEDKFHIALSSAFARLFWCNCRFVITKIMQRTQTDEVQSKLLGQRITDDLCGPAPTSHYYHQNDPPCWCLSWIWFLSWCVDCGSTTSPRAESTGYRSSCWLSSVETFRFQAAKAAANRAIDSFKLLAH